MTNETKGLSVFPGRVKGKVIIIREDADISKVNFGDILIAIKTKPEYVIAISKAGAIVTDVGGITSHAAIIAREFGTPCIVGTQNATHLFKTGDLVEVDAHKGMVRKIASK